jgi:hypothetical protein
MDAPLVIAPPPVHVAPPAVVASDPRRVFGRALVVTFLVLLGIGNLDLMLHLDPNPSPLREVVPFPRPHLDRSLVHWPGELRWYVKSSMGFRSALVRARGLLAWNWLHGSPAPTSVVRADPWLFLRNERVLEDFRRVDPFTDAELALWGTELERRRLWLESQGSHYLLVVPPNKETVYAEAMPAWATRAPGPSRLQQLTAYLKATSKVTVVDLTAALESKKGEGRLYHFTDTHWNDLGAFVGYQEVARRLAEWFPALRPAGLDQYVVSEELVPGGDLARTCGLKLDLPEPQIQLRARPGFDLARNDKGQPLTFDRMDVRGQRRFVTQAPAGEIPSAVILRDSFGEALIPFLSRHVRAATWIWTYDFPADTLTELRPSVVIQELVERKLMAIDPRHGDDTALTR